MAPPGSVCVVFFLEEKTRYNQTIVKIKKRLILLAYLVLGINSPETPTIYARCRSIVHENRKKKRKKDGWYMD